MSSLSAKLHERRRTAVAPGVGSVLSSYAGRARGGTIVDVDGHEFIDFASGIAVTSVGASAPAVVAAISEQASRFTHTCFMVTPYESYIEVCERLNELTPGAFEKRSALFNSGAEAVENAVKIARYATGRPAVVVFDHGYHGRTNLTMALTAKSMPYKHGFGPFAPEIYRVPGSYPLRDGLDGEAAFRRAVDLIQSQVGAANVAAIVIEPIQGEGGFITPAPGFLSMLSQWASANDVVFIADEIQTGFCRTGDWFASTHETIEPDLMTLAKGIAGGMPLAAVTGRASIMDSVHAGGLGGTYGGNPVACAAALATLDLMREADLCGAARAIGQRLTSSMTALADAHPQIAEVRGRAAMVAVELTRPGSLEPDPTLTTAVNKACHASGLLTLTCGTWGNVFRFLPPLTISIAELDRGLAIFESAFAGAVSS